MTTDGAALRVVLATNNPGKVREFRRLLEPLGIAAVTPAELGLRLEVEEDGGSYAENATKKAQAYADAAGMPALADDSGIEVDALGGGPGMHSARFGGPGLDDAGRTALLLERLAGVPAEQRTARYRAVVAVAWPRAAGREPALFEGVEEGAIGEAPRGERGFGYDPVFIPAEGQREGEVRTQAEFSDEEKDAISHRAKAVRAAAAWLRGQMG